MKNLIKAGIVVAMISSPAAQAYENANSYYQRQMVREMKQANHDRRMQAEDQRQRQISRDIELNRQRRQQSWGNTQRNIRNNQYGNSYTW
jgi:hypothetical protein